MNAVVYDTYGPPEVLRLQDLKKPKPADNQVLVKVFATTVTRYDCWMRSCTGPPGSTIPMRLWCGVRKPKRPVLGTELAGDIEAVGEGVQRFRVGDAVYGYPGMSLGAYAEYICLPEESVATKPANLTYEEAASVLQGGLTALFFLRKAATRSGQKVLVFGASGGVGIFAVQLAKHLFQADVTGICSTEKLELVRSIGADSVIDYTREDFTRRGEVYDIIFDTVGKSPLAASARSLEEDGVYLLATFGLPQLLPMLWLKLTSGKKVMSPLLKETKEDLIFLGELIEAETIRPVLDRCYPLHRAAEAHRYLETGQKKGSVVLTVAASPA